MRKGCRCLLLYVVVTPFLVCFLPFYLYLTVSEYIEYEPSHRAIVERLGIADNARWGTIIHHMDCELFHDGITSEALEAQLHLMGRHYVRHFRHRTGNGFTGDIMIAFYDVPVDTRYYEFKDNHLIKRSTFSLDDEMVIECK